MRASLSTGNIDPMKNLTSVRAVFSPDGSAYKGTWYNSLRHGQGTHVYPNGDCYTGEWAFNLPQGYGEFYTCLEPRPGKGVKKVIPTILPPVQPLYSRMQGIGTAVSVITSESITTALMNDTRACGTRASEAALAATFILRPCSHVIYYSVEKSTSSNSTRL